MSLENIKNSTVLVRVCYDLPELSDVARVRDSKNTILKLLSNNNKVVLLSHWDRPGGKKVADLSLRNQVQIISEIIGLEPFFVDQFEDFTVAKDLISKSTQNFFILENTRFDPFEQSKSPDERLQLAQKYSTLGEVFVDEAFPVSHRKEATNSELAGLLPSFKGFSYQLEITNLQKLKTNPSRPFVVIMAGSKLETKLPLINTVLPLADKLLLGGRLAFTFLKAAQEIGMEEYIGIKWGKSDVEEAFLDTAKRLLVENRTKLELPLDFIFGGETAESLHDDVNGFAYDVGDKSLKKYTQILATAKTVFWNGTPGYYELPPFNNSCLKIGEFLAENRDIYTVLGGGDTVASLPQNLLEKMDFVSMGGGATLEFLSN